MFRLFTQPTTPFVLREIEGRPAPPTRHSRPQPVILTEELATKESQMHGRLPPSDFRFLAALRSE